MLAGGQRKCSVDTEEETQQRSQGGGWWSVQAALRETDGVGLAPAVQEGGTEGGKFLTGGSLGLKGTGLSAVESRAVSKNTPVSGLAG